MRLPKWLVSAVLALELIMAMLQLLDAFHVWYFPMIHGYAYSLRFDLGFSLVLALLPVSSIILAYLFKGRKYREIFITFSISLGLYIFFGLEAAVAGFSLIQVVWALLYFAAVGDFLFWFLVLMTGFESTALIHWVLLPFGVSSPLVWFADLELSLFYVFAPLAPLMVIFIIFIVVLKLLPNRYLRIFGQFFTSRSNLCSGVNGEKIQLHPWTLLILSLVVAVVGALYPYSPSINSEGVAVGVDVHYYIEWMVPVEQDLFSAFTAANGSRPMMLLLIYVFQRGFGLGVLEVVKYLPVLLNPTLALSVFFMVLNATEDQEWAGLASLFSASGFTITVGMYSYFLTNMLGLILIFSSIGLLFKAIRTESKVCLVSASALGSLAVFTHPWTFAQYFTATTLFLVYMYFMRKRFGESLMILTYLVLTGLVDVFKGVLGGLEAYGVITSTAPKLMGVGEFWSNNIFAFRQMYGGLLSNTVLLGLAVYGVYLLNRQKPYQLFLMLLLMVSLVYYFMVHGSAQTKLLYNIPFSIFAALAILFFIRNTTFDRRKKTAILLFKVAYMVVYLLRSIANFF